MFGCKVCSVARVLGSQDERKTQFVVTLEMFVCVRIYYVGQNVLLPPGLLVNTSLASVLKAAARNL